MEDRDMQRQMMWACVGFGLVLACSPLSSAVEAVVSLGLFSAGVGGWVDQTVFIAAFASSLVVLGRRHRSGSLLAERSRFVGGALAAIEVGVVFIALGKIFSPHMLAVDLTLTVSSALRGAGVGLLLAAWIELLVSLSPRMRHFGTSLTVAVLLSAVFALGLWLLALVAKGWAAVAALAAAPAVDCLLLRRCAASLSGVPDRAAAPRTHIDMPFPTFLIIASFGVALGGTWVVIFAVSGLRASLYPCLGFLAASAVLAVMTRTVARTREDTFGMLLRASIFISALVFLLLPTLWPRWPSVAVTALGAAWAVQVFSFAFMPIQMIEKLPVSPLSVMGCGVAPVGIGAVLASVVGGGFLAILGADPYSLSIIAAIVCVPLLLAALLLPPHAADASALGIRSYMERETSIERLNRRCAEVAARCGLTEREAEVMLLLSQGLSRARVAEELVVSNETVKTHAKHIYEKLGVHSLREMTTFIETGKRGPDGAKEEPTT